MTHMAGDKLPAQNPLNEHGATSDYFAGLEAAIATNEAEKAEIRRRNAALHAGELALQ